MPYTLVLVGQLASIVLAAQPPLAAAATGHVAGRSAPTLGGSNPCPVPWSRGTSGENWLGPVIESVLTPNGLNDNARTDDRVGIEHAPGHREVRVQALVLDFLARSLQGWTRRRGDSPREFAASLGLSARRSQAAALARLAK